MIRLEKVAHARNGLDVGAYQCADVAGRNRKNGSASNVPVASGCHPAVPAIKSKARIRFQRIWPEPVTDWEAACGTCRSSSSDVLGRLYQSQALNIRGSVRFIANAFVDQRRVPLPARQPLRIAKPLPSAHHARRHSLLLHCDDIRPRNAPSAQEAWSFV